MLRAIGAVLAGFLTVFILSILTDIFLESIHFFPPINTQAAYVWWVLLIALIYRSLYAILGGYITALLSKKKAMRNVWILAGIGFVAATVGLLTNLSKPGLWYPILLVVTTIPSVWLGGKVYGK